MVIAAISKSRNIFSRWIQIYNHIHKQKTPLLGGASYGTNYFYMYAILKSQNQIVVLHILQISFFKP